MCILTSHNYSLISTTSSLMRQHNPHTPTCYCQGTRASLPKRPETLFSFKNTWPSPPLISSPSNFTLTVFPCDLIIHQRLVHVCMFRKSRKRGRRTKQKIEMSMV